GESGSASTGFRISPLLVAAVIAFNLWHLMGAPAIAFWGICACAGLCIYIERRTIPRSVVTICSILSIIAVVVWPFGGASLQSLGRGIYIGALISAVMASVSLLARAALRSPALNTLTTYLQGQSYRRRYILLAISAQILPCMLG